MSVEILAKLEDVLRDKAGGGARFVSADYFDFFAGASTGAIIVACLAIKCGKKDFAHTRVGIALQ